MAVRKAGKTDSLPGKIVKVALICKHYLLSKGGLERYTISLSRELLKRGHEVHVFANRWQEETGIVFHHVPMLRLSSPLKNISFAYFTRKLLQEHRFDVIQSMERILSQDIFRASDGINPIQMSERYSNRAVRQWKALGPRRQALSYLEKRIFERSGCRYVMTNSRLVKNQILDHYRISPDRICVIYNSVDHRRFNPSVREKYRIEIRTELGIPETDMLLLFAGNDFQRKGLALLVQSLNRLQNPRLKLMVVGHDRAGSRQKRIAKNQLGDRIIFLGSQSRIEKYYGAADLLILPTRYDAFANVCLEAMACGIPVITTRTNGAGEIIDNGIHGYVLDTWEPEELASKIARCISDDQFISEMGKHAFGRADTFTGERYMSELMDLYDRVRIQKEMK